MTVQQNSWSEQRVHGDRTLCSNMELYEQSQIGHGTVVLGRLHHSAESDPTLEEEEHHGLTKHLDPTEVHGDRIACSIKEFTGNYSQEYMSSAILCFV